MTEPALAVQGLHAYYGESHILQGVDLEVDSGEAVSLIGRNGAGKTTTIASIAGFLRPRGGSVRVHGADLTGAPPHRVARALMRNPTVLLLDEPSEGLAPKLVEQVGEILTKVRATGLAVLLVEQNLGLATRVGQRVLVMNKGTIVFAGTPAALAMDRDVEARYLGV